MLKLRRYFTGRLSRKGYWLGQLMLLVIQIVSLLVAAFIAIVLAVLLNPGDAGQKILIDVVIALWVITVVIPFAVLSIGTQVRRCHDLNFSGWAVFIMYLISVPAQIGSKLVSEPYTSLLLIPPTIYAIFTIVIGCRKQDSEPNIYGEHKPYTTLREAILPE